MPLSKSGIPYLTHVWNVAVGCLHKCKGCWARERWAPRIGANIGCELCRRYEPHIHPERWGDVTPRQKPKVIGVGFFADLCGDWTWREPDGSVLRTDPLFDALKETIEECPQHIFVSLTQRPDRLPDIEYPDNWWWGVTVRNQAEADERIPALMASTVPHPWVSYEPALGPVDFAFTGTCPKTWRRGYASVGYCVYGVIAGGQSGPGAVPSRPDWFRSVRDQCREAGVPFSFKQWGKWWPAMRGSFDVWPTDAPVYPWHESWSSSSVINVPERLDCMDAGAFVAMWHKPGAGRLLDGREHVDLPWGGKLDNPLPEEA